VSQHDHAVDDRGVHIGAVAENDQLRLWIMAGLLFGLIISFDEVVVTLFRASPRQTTLPVRIYQYIELTSDPSIAAISTLLIVVTTIAVLLVEKYLGFARRPLR